MSYRDAIDSHAALPNELDYKTLRAQFYTGRSVLLNDRGYEKKYGYRHGVQTPIGDIEVNVWCEAMKELIEKNGDTDLYDKLFDWYKGDPVCGKTKREQELYVLNVFSNNIFDNPKWVDYIPFNEKYRPEILAARASEPATDSVVGDQQTNGGNDNG